MSKNTTTSENNTHRRSFIKQSAAITGAVLLGGSPMLATSPANALQATELQTAVDLLTEIKGSQKSGLLLLIVEHIGALVASGNTREVESAISAIRAQVATDAAKLRRRTRDDLTALTREQ